MRSEFQPLTLAQNKIKYFRAHREEHKRIISFIVNKGSRKPIHPNPNPNSKRLEMTTGNQCLHYASKYGNINMMMKVFVEKVGANVNGQNKIGYAPLHVALYYK